MTDIAPSLSDFIDEIRAFTKKEKNETSVGEYHNRLSDLSEEFSKELIGITSIDELKDYLQILNKFAINRNITEENIEAQGIDKLSYRSRVYGELWAGLYTGKDIDILTKMYNQKTLYTFVSAFNQQIDDRIKQLSECFNNLVMISEKEFMENVLPGLKDKAVDDTLKFFMDNWSKEVNAETLGNSMAVSNSMSVSNDKVLERQIEKYFVLIKQGQILVAKDDLMRKYLASVTVLDRFHSNDGFFISNTLRRGDFDEKFEYIGLTGLYFRFCQFRRVYLVCDYLITAINEAINTHEKTQPLVEKTDLEKDKNPDGSNTSDQEETTEQKVRRILSPLKEVGKKGTVIMDGYNFNRLVDVYVNWIEKQELPSPILKIDHCGTNPEFYGPQRDAHIELNMTRRGKGNISHALQRVLKMNNGKNEPLQASTIANCIQTGGKS